jgi:hypothetical protein
VGRLIQPPCYWSTSSHFHCRINLHIFIKLSNNVMPLVLKFRSTQNTVKNYFKKILPVVNSAFLFFFKKWHGENAENVVCEMSLLIENGNC